MTSRDLRLTTTAPGLPGLGPFILLAHEEDGHLWAAPLGSPPWTLPVPAAWVEIGPVDALPTAHEYLGDLRRAYEEATDGQR
jgi:hypothetical protein